MLQWMMPGVVVKWDDVIDWEADWTYPEPENPEGLYVLNTAGKTLWHTPDLGETWESGNLTTQMTTTSNGLTLSFAGFTAQPETGSVLIMQDWTDTDSLGRSDPRRIHSEVSNLSIPRVGNSSGYDRTSAYTYQLLLPITGEIAMACYDSSSNYMRMQMMGHSSVTGKSANQADSDGAWSGGRPRVARSEYTWNGSAWNAKHCMAAYYYHSGSSEYANRWIYPSSSSIIGQSTTYGALYITSISDTSGSPYFSLGNQLYRFTELFGFNRVVWTPPSGFGSFLIPYRFCTYGGKHGGFLLSSQAFRFLIPDAGWTSWRIRDIATLPYTMNGYWVFRRKNLAGFWRYNTETTQVEVYRLNLETKELKQFVLPETGVASGDYRYGVVG